MNFKDAEKYNDIFSGRAPEDILNYFLKEFNGKVVFSTGLGAEDQVLAKMISDIDPSSRIITLDTGRLFQETYDLLDLTQKRYKINIEVFFPDPKQVEEMVNEKGINLFYESIENRKFCCQIRKIEPLKRALKGLDAWICGLRKEQSTDRKNSKVVEWDEQHNLLKINPLINWTNDEVWHYIKQYNVPYNKLHDKGYPSIGCLPCTRAVEPGEDSRSGRWWWEMGGHKECGLHKK